MCFYLLSVSCTNKNYTLIDLIAHQVKFFLGLLGNSVYYRQLFIQPIFIIFMDQLIIFAGNHPVLSAAWAAIVVLIIITTIRIQMSPVKQISTQELTFLVNREEGVVVDIRTEKEFKTSRIIDSKNLVKEKVTNNDFATLENYKDKPIIVVCTAGITAATVASQMLKAGFTKVSLLKGGMNSWVNAGLPLVKK